MKKKVLSLAAFAAVIASATAEGGPNRGRFVAPAAVGGAWRGAALNRAAVGRPALWHQGFNGGPRQLWRGGQYGQSGSPPDYAPSWGYGPWFGIGPWGWDSWGGYTRTSEYDIDACWIRNPDTGGWMRRCY